MANKRDFKKYVEAVGGTICDEMMLSLYTIEGIDETKVQEAVTKVLTAVGNATSNSNVFFDKGHKAFASEKEYSQAKKLFFRSLFKKVNTDFKNEVEEALKEFNAAVPAEQKAKLKEAANA